MNLERRAVKREPDTLQGPIVQQEEDAGERDQHGLGHEAAGEEEEGEEVET